MELFSRNWIFFVFLDNLMMEKVWDDFQRAKVACLAQKLRVLLNEVSFFLSFSDMRKNFFSSRLILLIFLLRISFYILFMKCVNLKKGKKTQIKMDHFTFMENVARNSIKVAKKTRPWDLWQGVSTYVFWILHTPCL